MQKLISTLQVILACAVVAAVALTPRGQARPSETVACSSIATPKVSLSGIWTGSDKGTYRIRQVGTCIWLTGTPPNAIIRAFSMTAFFGTVSSTGRSVIGLWAGVPTGGNGSLILKVRSSRLLTRSASTGGFPAFKLSR